MEQQIKLLRSLLVGGRTYEAGEILILDQERAKRIVALNQAEFVVPDPHEPHGTRHTTTSTTHAPAGHDPHEQHHESATSMPPTEKGVTRSGPPDPKGHHKK